MSRRDPLVVLLQMRDQALEAVQMLNGVDEAQFSADRKLQLAVTLLTLNTGEAAGRVRLAERRRYGQIDWDRIISFRHRLAHGYDTIDLRLVWTTVRSEFPALVEQLNSILPVQSTD